MKKIIVKETKEIVRMAVGAIMLGGIIKQDWLSSNWFVWVSFAMFVMIIFLLGKAEENL